MLEVRAAVDVEEEAVGLDGDCGDDYAITGAGGLALVVDHFFVGVAAGDEVAVGHEGEVVGERESAVGEALLGGEVADEFATAELVDGLIGELDFGGVKNSVEMSAVADFSPTTKTWARACGSAESAATQASAVVR